MDIFYHTFETSLSSLILVQVKVYEYLMSHNKMEPSHVKVISQYNAQCFAIRGALKRKRFDNSNVTTVVSSQGNIRISL